jgi:hypothetical protein
MTKHVLVLCQRKTGTGVSATGVLGRVEDMVVPQINDFVKSKLGEDVTIEYLTNAGGQVDGTADYNLLLNDNPENKAAVDFIRNHTGYYSLIILNTCPYISMDYQLIYDLLTPDGMMAFTKYPAPLFQRKEDGSLVDVLHIDSAKVAVAELFEDTGIYYYKKLSQKKQLLNGGNKQKRKSKNTKKRNRRNKKLSVHRNNFKYHQ